MLNFLHKYSGEYEKLQKEMAQPNKNQKQEKFKKRDKLAIIISNEKYGKTIMADLSAVKDDHLNIR